MAHTWNYAVVHAYGSLRTIDDATWVRAQLEAFTYHNEAAFPEPWAVSDAPYPMFNAIKKISLTVSLLQTKINWSGTTNSSF